MNLLDTIHIQCHALRLIPDYKASKFEVDINKLICEEYQNKCKECKESLERIKSNPVQAKKGFFEGIFHG